MVALVLTSFQLLFAISLNMLWNWTFHESQFYVLLVYLVGIVYHHYKWLEKISKMVIIDPEKLNSILQQEKIKALKPETVKEN